jgi:dTDP-glucose 4,6-dehydratase
VVTHRPVLVTGGAGFIGSALVRRLCRLGRAVVNLDRLTYAGRLESLREVQDDAGHLFVHGDIGDSALVAGLLREHRPAAVVHLAAESHVDRSIDGPDAFIQTNLVGTFRLLEAVRGYLATLPPAEAAAFRFVHASTDEVFGALGEQGHFVESSPYAPRSPYAATKAGSDHLARAWGHTFGVPVVVTNCSNNYGPCQFPEKLVPRVITRALRGLTIPVYGEGRNVRDWIFVEDHVDGLLTVLEQGRPGETLLFGGGAQRRNIDLVLSLCGLLDEFSPAGAPHRDLIRFVADRPGHDFRYAIDDAATRQRLGWSPSRTLDQGLRSTVRWYLDNRWWWEPLVPAPPA